MVYKFLLWVKTAIWGNDLLTKVFEPFEQIPISWACFITGIVSIHWV